MLGTICTGFNPRPSSLTGEPKRRHGNRRQWWRFNPRPSSLTGEPRIARDEDYIEAMVSIRARHR